MCLFNKPSRDFFCAEGGGRRYSWLSRLVDWGTQREVEPLRPREEPPHPELPVRPGEGVGGAASARTVESASARSARARWEACRVQFPSCLTPTVPQDG